MALQIIRVHLLTTAYHFKDEGYHQLLYEDLVKEDWQNTYLKNWGWGKDLSQLAFARLTKHC